MLAQKHTIYLKPQPVDTGAKVNEIYCQLLLLLFSQ